MSTTDTLPYQLPDTGILAPPTPPAVITRDELDANLRAINGAVKNAGLAVTVACSLTGPQATRYELKLGPGVALEEIAALQPEIAEALKVRLPIRMLLPIPGVDRCGIEIPHLNHREFSCGELFADDAWQNATAAVPLLLGRDMLNAVTVLDLAEAAHLLLAGDTEASQTSCIRQFITSLAMRFAPQDFRLLLCDTRGNSFKPFAALPHLLAPTVKTPDETQLLLDWLGEEMKKRQRAFAEGGIHSFEEYNTANPDDKLPRIAMIINEISPLLGNKNREEIVGAIQRLIPAGTFGLHLIVSTQFPYSENLGNDLKGCFNCRIAFKTAQQQASMLILDEAGAENLIDEEDLLVKCGSEAAQRCQCAKVSDEECRALTAFCAKQQAAKFDEAITKALAALHAAAKEAKAAAETAEPLLPFNEPSDAPAAAQPPAGAAVMALDALAAIVAGTPASIDGLKTAFGLSEDRALELLDQLTTHQYLGAKTEDGSPREILTANLPGNAKTRKTIESLYAELAQKIAAGDTSSRTVKEFNGGVHAIGKKIVEEAAEVWMSSEYEAPEHAAEEISQLIYHLLVMMIRKKITLEDIYKYL